MIKIELTKEDIVNAEPGQILFAGQMKDSEEGLFINGTGKLLKYVAVRGIGYHDWTIYAEDCYRDMTFEEVKTTGHKILMSTAKKFVSAPEDVWDLWRN